MSDGLPIHVDDVPAQRWEHGELGATRRRLGIASGAKRLGIALIEIDPGKRSTPPHSHADEDEAFLVLAGSGLSYQSSGSKDVRTYAIRVDDLVWHPANGDGHTVIAGDHGLTVLVVAEGSRTNITYLPGTKQFWLGPRWSPADTRHPFAADAELGPLELPEPTDERPPTIRNLAELPLHEGREGRLAYATRDLRDMGSDKLVLAQDAMPPETHNPICTSIRRARRRGTSAAEAGSPASARTRTRCAPARSGCVGRTRASGTASRSAHRAWSSSRWAT